MRILLDLVAALLYWLASLFAASLNLVPATPAEYGANERLQRYATQQEYLSARADDLFQLCRTENKSDGLTVFAYVYAPLNDLTHTMSLAQKPPSAESPNVFMYESC